MLEPALLIARKIKTRSGCEAFVVGGAVRDSLLGIEPKDLDIATSATPKQVEEVAQALGWGFKPTAPELGVTKVNVKGVSCEVATFRNNETYSHGHRPDSIKFASDIAEDLKRRDFTINAMALSPDGTFVDPFGGKKDLDQGIIRTIKKDSFAEDPLRILRAARFASRFGYSIEKGTFKEMCRDSNKLEELPKERVLGEIRGILLSKNPGQGINILHQCGALNAKCGTKENGLAFKIPILPEISNKDGIPQNEKYHDRDVLGHLLKTTDSTPPDLPLRWAGLLHDISKGEEGVRGFSKDGSPTDHDHEKAGAKKAEEIMTRLGESKSTTARTCWLIKNHMHTALDFSPAEDGGKALLRWAKKRSAEFPNRRSFEEACGQLISLKEADSRASKGLRCTNRQDIIGFLKKATLYKEDLAIKGKDVMSVLGEGSQVARFQNNIMDRINAGDLSNNKDSLVQALHKTRTKTISNIMDGKVKEEPSLPGNTKTSKQTKAGL